MSRRWAMFQPRPGVALSPAQMRQVGRVGWWEEAGAEWPGLWRSEGGAFAEPLDLNFLADPTPSPPDPAELEAARARRLRPAPGIRHERPAPRPDRPA